MVLLHISDLHFGSDADINAPVNRKLALNGLFSVLRDLDEDWRPSSICVTGDIGWKATKDDYKEATAWFRSLLDVLKLTSRDLFFAVGNHDIDRAIAKTTPRPSNAREADDALAYPLATQYSEPFSTFGEFCRNLGVPPYRVGEEESFVLGHRAVGDISFVSLNSAWFSREEKERGKLWLGLPLIKFIESKGQLPQVTEITEHTPVIVLFHHPSDWLHSEEIHAYSRQNTFDYVARRCHLILTGHTHGEIRNADRIAEQAWHLAGGAAYAGSDYANSFRLIRVGNEDITYRSFQFDPRSPDNIWRPAHESRSLPLRHQGLSLVHKTDRSLKLAAFRMAALNTARRLIELKSRALKPSGPLPEIVRLDVTAYVRGPEIQFSRAGRTLEFEKNRFQRMPLTTAMRLSRRSLLLGDLGTGKSTIAASFVADANQTDENQLAFIVPANGFGLIEGSTSSPHKTKDFLGRISEYFNNEICPGTSGFDLRELLRDRTEVTIAVDGLDEVNGKIAREILRQLSAVVDHWPSVRVLATARPVEIIGVAYGDWQVLAPPRLDDDDRVALMQASLVADGQQTDQAEMEAQSLLDVLQRFPDLNAMANSPLAVRLLSPTLQQMKTKPGKITIGDLLFKLLEERLGLWAERDNKQSVWSKFDSAFPGSATRLELAAELAQRLEDNNTKEQVLLLLKHIVGRHTRVDLEQVVAEAFSFLTQSGLLAVNGTVQFAIQPLQEALRGYGLTIAQSGTHSTLTDFDPRHWRIVSFSATAARRLGISEQLRTAISSFVQKLVIDSRESLAASYVIAEFQDGLAATQYIQAVQKLGPRPFHLPFRSEEWIQGARAIAESIKLAGQVGFDFFFTEYLDPQYPIINLGSAIPERIFAQWAEISIDQSSDYETQRLGSLVMPHMEADTQQSITFLPYLALLTPQFFEQKDRIWHLARLLDSPTVSSYVRKELVDANRSDAAITVQGTLLDHAKTGHEQSVAAADLYLDLYSEEPPLPIVKAILRGQRGERRHRLAERAMGKLRDRLEPAVIVRLLRWFLFDVDSHLSAGAAIRLFQAGILDRPLLGDGLLRGLHDGGYIAGAEQILTTLLKAEGTSAARWLTDQLHEQDHHFGMHSGWWRIFLSILPTTGPDGPALLSRSMSGIGEFLLARNPEVRQGFQSILLGKEGGDYRHALHECLVNNDPFVKRGAAMVLITSDPQSEGQALETVVRFKRQFGAWHEWDAFCLSLSFGPIVLTHLKSILGSLDREAEVFALAILFKSGIQLDASQRDRLLRGLLDRVIDLGSWGEPLWRSPDTLKTLLTIVETSDPLAPSAAEILLRYFSDRLSSDEEAGCIVIRVSGTAWETGDILTYVSRLQADTSFADRIERASAVLLKIGHQRPFIDLLRGGLAGEGVWEDVIWRQLGDDTKFSQAEDNGDVLLRLARSFPAIRIGLGRAATKCLADPRIQGSRSSEARLWLALIGNEAGLCSLDELRRLLVDVTPVWHSAPAAILARLKAVPDGFKRKRSSSSRELPRPEVVPDESRIKSAITDMARTSTALHPALCSTLEQSLFRPQLTDSDMNALASEGQNGFMIATTLRVTYGAFPHPEWIIGLFDFFPDWEQRQDQCLQRLMRMSQTARAQIVISPEQRNAYLEQLDAFLLDEPRRGLTVIAEILSVRGFLRPEQVIPALVLYAKEPAYYRFRVAEKLAHWLSSSISDDVLTPLQQATDRALALLDSHIPMAGQEMPENAGPFLLFPLLTWKLHGNVDARSERLFLRGLRMIFFSGDPQQQRTHRGTELLRMLEPLFSSVSPTILERVISSGRSSDDASTRVLCRLFTLVN